MQVLVYILQGCAVLIIVFAAFSAGSFYQREKLADEWERVEREWADFNRERARWRDRVSRI
jgi:hypothetical protein